MVDRPIIGGQFAHIMGFIASDIIARIGDQVELLPFIAGDIAQRDQMRGMGGTIKFPYFIWQKGELAWPTAARLLVQPNTPDLNVVRDIAEEGKAVTLLGKDWCIGATDVEIAGKLIGHAGLQG